MSTTIPTVTIRPLVLCGPSGSGKSTLLKRLMDEFEGCFGFSVSHTTRKPRPGEINGREYHFMDRTAMERAIANGDFIEYAEYSGNLYGTSKRSVEAVQKAKKICVLDIDVQGVKIIKKMPGLNAKYVFVAPPSMELLEQRLRDRGTESDESLKKRMDTAKKEMLYAETAGNFDIVIVNDKVEDAYSKLRTFVIDDVNNIKQLNANIIDEAN